MNEAMRIKGLLSFSEIDVLRLIHKEMNGTMSKNLVVSKLCDKDNVTRSVAVNALIKLEIANIVSTRSMGRKGLNIQVVNKQMFDEICKGTL